MLSSREQIGVAASGSPDPEDDGNGEESQTTVFRVARRNAATDWVV